MTYLNSKDRNTSSSLCQDPVTWHQPLAVHAVQRVPCRQTGAAQGRTLEEVQVLGHVHETMLLVDAVLLECTVDHTAYTAADAAGIDGAEEVALVEESDDLVSGLELVDVGADGFDDTGAVRGGDYTVTLGEGVETLGNDQVTVVEGGAVDCGC